MKPRCSTKGPSKSSSCGPQERGQVDRTSGLHGDATAVMPMLSQEGQDKASKREGKQWYLLVCLVIFCVCLCGVLCIFVATVRYGPGCIEVEDKHNVAPETNDPSNLMPSSVECLDECTFSLVESIPQNLTYGPGEHVHTSTYAGLKILLASAQKSVRIASFYWTLRGSDIAFHDDSAKEGEDIFNTLLQLSKTKRVSVQIAQNAVNNDTDLLAKEGGAEVRTLNFTRLLGAGILHTKFWLVDDRHLYIGSANLDWRSLTQVKELGILVQNCSCLAGDLQKVFDVYWYLGQPKATVPHTWPTQFNTSINAHSPAIVHFNNTQAPVYMSSSPPPFCPGGRTGDIDAILAVIRQAQHFVYIAVMDYSPSTLYLKHNVYWPVIDDALREAAFNRHVSVRLLASQWKHTKKDMYTFLCSLQMMARLRYPRTRVEVKLFEVPVYTKNQSEIPFSRVNHNKYMVTDQHAYIGTSNWSGDYFISTAGVGFVVKQPEDAMNTTRGNVRQQLYDVFTRDWYSNYTSELSCSFNTTGPDPFQL